MAERKSNQITFGEQTYLLDGYGFLDPPEQWDEAFAEGMARMVGIFDGLTEEHWRFVHYLRRRFLEEQVVVMLIFACRDNGLTLGKLMSLFPTGYHRGACKIAGINFAFMSSHNILLTYENYVTLRTEHRLTDDGFLANYTNWNRRFARLVASEWNLADGVDDLHWSVIDYLRGVFTVRGAIPTVHETCRAHRLSLDKLHELFPDGYRRGACRMAGLPFHA